MILAYIGPEILLPTTSIIAAVAGVVLVLGRNSLRYLLGLVAAARRPGKAPHTVNGPPA